jgi:hypothetical protein
MASPEHPISGPSVPIWVILPGTPGGGQADPDYDISSDRPNHDLPGPQPPDDLRPTHPIVLPPELVDPDWGIEENQPRPDHELPQPEEPVDPGYGIPETPVGDGGERPAHPIYLPPYPDNSLPEGAEQVGSPTFYQRKTLGINWGPEQLAPSLAVGIYAVEGETSTLVRTVANDGSSSVTYPQDFTGEVTIRVAGANGYLEGTFEVA